jgi:cystathionine beta-lyase
MPYDFDKIIPRRQTDSYKWNEYDPSVLPLWVADMDFPAPPSVIQALHQRIEHGIFGYARLDCDLYDTIIERLGNLYGWKVEKDEILLFSGVMKAVHLATLAVTQPREAVLVQTPVYPLIYKTPPVTRRMRQVMQLSRTADGSYSIDFDAFEAALTPVSSSALSSSAWQKSACATTSSSVRTKFTATCYMPAMRTHPSPHSHPKSQKTP